MTKFRVTLVGLLLFALMLGSPRSAEAGGFGGFFEYSRAFSTPADFNTYSVGFSLDTNVSKNRLFNYRLNVGYQWSNFSDGLSLDNAFGFGVLRNRHVRLWIGPSVRLGVDSINSSPFVDLLAGGGAVFGVNFHTGNAGSAAFTLGYQYLYIGTVNTINETSTGSGDHRIQLKFSYFFRSRGDRFLPPKLSKE